MINVYHGWAFPEFVAQFKSLKKAMEFILSQECPDDWCWEEEKECTS